MCWFSYDSYKRLINLQELCLHSTVLEATLVHDSGGEQSWSFWVQWDISGWRRQYAGKPNQHIILLQCTCSWEYLTDTMCSNKWLKTHFYNSPQNPDRYEQIIIAVQSNYTAIGKAILS